MQFSTNKGVVSIFDSVPSMANIQIPECNMLKYKEMINEYGGDQQHWLGVKTFTKLKEIAELYGWPEGVKKGKMIVDSIVVPKLPSVKRKKKWGPTGMMLNISRMYSGGAEKAWLTTYKEMTDGMRAKRTPVTIVIDVCANEFRSPDSFFWRGALGTILASALQRSGRSVRIIAASRISNKLVNGNDYNNYSEHLVLLDVKHYGQQVEYNTMFSVTALAGFFRYYFFKAYLSIPVMIEDGIGTPKKVSSADLEFIDDGNPIIVIENIWSEESALRKAKNLLDEI